MPSAQRLSATQLSQKTAPRAKDKTATYTHCTVSGNAPSTTASSTITVPSNTPAQAKASIRPNCPPSQTTVCPPPPVAVAVGTDRLPHLPHQRSLAMQAGTKLTIPFFQPQTAETLVCAISASVLHPPTDSELATLSRMKLSPSVRLRNTDKQLA